MAKNKNTATAEATNPLEGVKPAKIKKDKPPKEPKPSTSSSGDDMSLGGPGSGGQFVAKELVNELLLITPTSLEEGVVTSFGEQDAIKADIVVLNKRTPDESTVIDGGLIFQRVLQGQLQDALRKRTRVVGTLIEDTASQKKGQSAPYRLTAPSDSDINVAKAYLDSLNPLR